MKHGWWIFPAFLLGAFVICVLLILWLLPQANTGGGAVGILAITATATILGGMISVWVLK